MVKDKDFDAYAGIHYKDLGKSDPNSYGGPLVVQELGNLGIGALLIPNKKAYDFEQGLVVAHLARATKGSGPDEYFELTSEPVEEFEIGSNTGLEVVRARVLIPEALESRIPVLNGPNLRRIGASKWSQYEIAHEFMPRTQIIRSGEPFDKSMVETIVGGKIVVKADMSQGSDYIDIVDRNQVGSAVFAIRQKFEQEAKRTGKARPNEDILLQEYHPGIGWDKLVGLDEASNLALSSNNEVELRVFCFADTARNIPSSLRYHAVARVTDTNGVDEWAYVDQASVPSNAWEIADEISDRMLSAAKVTGGFFAVDLFKTGVVDGEGIMVREINTRDPMMVDPSENYQESLIQRRLLANLMAELAKNGKKPIIKE